MKIIYFIFTVIFLAGCYGQPIRSGKLDQNVDKFFCHLDRDKASREICANDAIYTIGLGSEKDKLGKVSLFILEINDQGIIENKEVADRALEIIKKNMEGENKPVVNLFVHGWENNAEPDNKNLVAFENALLALNRSQEANSREEVIGIYVSWRGKTLPSIGHYLTFWNRKSVSEEVGRGDLTNFIFKAEALLKPDNNKQGRFILSGHSFGASALYNAVSHELISRFYRSIEQQKTDPSLPIRGIGDLVILLNPAIEALRFRSLREAIYEEGIENPNIFKNNKSPIFVILSSEYDLPVSKAFPIGRQVNELLSNNHGKMAIYKGINDKNPVQKSIRKAEITSIGFYSPYHTHFILSSGDIYEEILPHLYKEKSKEEQQELEATGERKLNFTTCLSKDIKNEFKKLERLNINWLDEIYNDGNNENFYTVINSKNQNKPIDLFYFKITNNVNLWNEKVQDKNRDIFDNYKEIGYLTWKRNPYWFMQAQENFMKGHGDIWNANVACLLLALRTTDTVSNQYIKENPTLQVVLPDTLSSTNTENSEKAIEIENSTIDDRKDDDL